MDGLRFHAIDSPIGTIGLVVSDAGVAKVLLAADGIDEERERIGELAEVPLAARQLEEYFAGRRREFTVPLDFRFAGGFRAAVLAELVKVPFGTTTTYGALAREVARAHRRRQPLCLMILDIDRFKAINDVHSHAAGDEVLRETGTLLAEVCRASDIAARIGGEEFAIILVDATLDEAHGLYARLRDAFARRDDWGGVAGLRVTISAGASMLDPLDTAPAQLMRRADMALYRAKSAGRDQLCDI